MPPEVAQLVQVIGLPAFVEGRYLDVLLTNPLATALMPHIGYARAAEISKQSVKEGVLIRDMVRRDGILPAEQVDDVLDLRKMTEIGVPGGGRDMSAGG